MALPVDIEALDKAFSGIGVDEKSLISILTNSNEEHKKSLRKGSSKLFIEDAKGFERSDQFSIKILKHQFKRFRDAVMLSVLHPWERDARLIEKAIRKGPKHYNVIVEMACTRSSDQLLGARKAYHSLFHHSIEEHLVTHIKGRERKLLVALVSAYRFDGPGVNEDVAKSEAQILYEAINNGEKNKLLDHEDAIMILATRSKQHLQALYQHYNQSYDKTLAQVLEAAVKEDADEESKRALTRVIVTQKEQLVKEGFVPNKIQDILLGLYKDFMLASIASGDIK
ncbi:hypothetical protein GOBAR_AA05390 [Gossypium barbadense]|uniref:Annexin n=1 Tax=Gossypium barbadense TaxID=3634 RepID=A0A2P5YHW8_GOSBA|nr:hypothetical protein GOBAR_AA05390 [Gossypium barbadense]